jgi:agmatine/peptidylarginine deiminase
MVWNFELFIAFQTSAGQHTATTKIPLINDNTIENKTRFPALYMDYLFKNNKFIS